ncbi:hypothetical protein GPECTOR_11g230 [Gonium pectorale]|uniref:Uncharacterized protein n=1 Tax=Gonium pectorale TaxID=33097 RepID=A0A150GPM7_GONPE|nr:hypothetical protein GPECTOR_11g230 [Gonium pectorale]|eukprot:KXZ51787.1 hypothetical protein GPECTOR_11g230 [Gonium pectorale]
MWLTGIEMSEKLRAAKSLEEHIKQDGKRRIPAPEQAPKAPKPSKPFLPPRFQFCAFST